LRVFAFMVHGTVAIPGGTVGVPGGIVIVFSTVTVRGGNSSELRGPRTASRNPVVAIAIMASTIQTTLRDTI
jgi:hypothetical protein